MLSCLSIAFLMPFLLSYESEEMQVSVIGRMERYDYPRPDRESAGAEAVRLIGDCKAEGAGAGRSVWLSN